MAGRLSDGVPSFADVLAARPRVEAALGRTPLHPAPRLSRRLGAEIRLKHENHHALGAFKVRGGVNLAACLDDDARRGGLFTASSGNHGQSIAQAGRLAGVPVVVAVPEGANPSKVAAMRALGADVVFHGADFDQAREWVTGEAERRGGRFIGPTDPELIAGVATLSLEILEDWPQVEVMIVPVGGGSGASGACLVTAARAPSVRVIGVQSEQAPTAWQAWKQGHPVEGVCATRAEGLATRVSFENTQCVLRDPEHGLDDFVLVSDDQLDDAVRLLAVEAHTLAERAGAAPLAAALDLRGRLAGRRVALVVSGGNLSEESIRKIFGGADPALRA